MRVSTTQEEEKKELTELLEKAKDNHGEITVYTILRHVSRSGMMRVIQMVIFIDGHPYFLGHSASKLLALPYDRDREGVKVDGFGMDMGFHLVYTLSAVLFGYADRGGYKLNHRWL